MNGFRRLIREIHRRSLWQVLSIYIVGSWIVYQVVLDLVEGLGLPEWVPPIALILFLIGLPVVLATAFVQEGFASGGTQAAAGTAEPVEKPVPRSAGERVFTWRKAMVAGAVAFGLLLLVTVAWAASRALGIGPAATLFAQGSLNERDRILLGDFESPPQDSLIAATITEALRIDLEQSTVVRLVEAHAVEAALRRMGRDPGATLDRATVEELAVREGIPAVLAGEVHRAGESYVVAARLVSPDGGGTLASFRHTARDASDIVAAVDRLSEDVRAKIGESLRSVRASEPLEQVTTASLPALQRYSRAMRLIAAEPESRPAIALLEEAVALDSTFAMAHLRLGLLYSFVEDRTDARQRNAAAAAFRHRDRLTPRERYMAEIAYHDDVTGDDDARDAAADRLQAEYPDHPESLEIIGYRAMYEGRYAEMEQIARRLIETDSSRALSWEVLFNALGRLGRWDELGGLYDDYLRRFPADSLYVLNARGHLAAARHEWAEAERLWRRLADARVANNPYLNNALETLAALALLRGRLHEYLDLELRAWRAEGASAAEYRIHEATIPLEVRGWHGLPVQQAVTAAREVVNPDAIDSLTPVPTFPLRIAARFAQAGDAATARRLAEAWDRTADDAQRRLAAHWRSYVDGHIAAAEGRTEEALDALGDFRAEMQGDCPTCGLGEIARVHDAAARPDSARVYYEQALRTPAQYGIEEQAWSRPIALRRLGAIYEAEGRLEDARAAYAEFIELWQDADAELQPQVEAARQRLQALTRAVG